MTNISLRAYHRKIEHLIEDKIIDQALFHCYQLLNEFPRNHHTYRLASRALLDSGDLAAAEAGFDILLQVEPDDFIAHVGKSMIAESTGNLELAISHMKQAFEIQPANEGLQSEVRRLLEKKDSVPPNKVMLTRGALIKMYMRGKLYDQAIGEIMIGLNESPHRIDFKVALAECLMATDKPVQAVEISLDIIKKMPFCLKPNEILHRVLKEKNYPSERDQSIQRLTALDPYYAYMLPTTLSVLDVPDIAVMTEEWELPEPLALTVDWTEFLLSRWNSYEPSASPTEGDLEAAIQKIIDPAFEPPFHSLQINTDQVASEEIIETSDEPAGQAQEELQEDTIKSTFSRRAAFVSKLKGLDNLIDESLTTPQEATESFNANPSIQLAQAGELEFQPSAPHEHNWGLEPSAGEDGGDISEELLPTEAASVWVSGEEEITQIEEHESRGERKEDQSTQDQPAAYGAQRVGDTQPISVKPVDPAEVMLEAEKAINGGNYNYALNLLRPLIEKNLHLAEISGYLEKAVEQYPEKTSFLLMLGEVYTRMQDREKALEIFHKAQNLISL